jgi:hypothetical protein
MVPNGQKTPVRLSECTVRAFDILKESGWSEGRDWAWGWGWCWGRVFVVSVDSDAFGFVLRA